VIAEDPFVAVSGGRSLFRVGELLELARLIEDLKGLKQREECKGNDVNRVKGMMSGRSGSGKDEWPGQTDLQAVYLL
jgi:hypothetical protein